MNTENLEKEYIKAYEREIGIDMIIEKQKSIRYNSRGIEGKKWLSLSPSIISDEVKLRLNTIHEIAYWVNYGDDETYGMFSVESIVKWLTTPDLLLYKLGGKRERIVHNK